MKLEQLLANYQKYGRSLVLGLALGVSSCLGTAYVGRSTPPYYNPQQARQEAVRSIYRIISLNTSHDGAGCDPLQVDEEIMYCRELIPSSTHVGNQIQFTSYRRETYFRWSDVRTVSVAGGAWHGHDLRVEFRNGRSTSFFTAGAELSEYRELADAMMTLAHPRQ